MSNRKATKRALLTSVTALVMCVVMLVGTTFAWFTDTASTGVNKIQAGNLDVELLMYKKITDTSYDYVNISKEKEPIFGSYESTVAQDKNLNTLWEPGKTQVAYLAIENKGNLALKYKVALNVTNPENSKDLYKVMQYAIVPDAKNDNGKVTGWTEGNSVVVGQQEVSDEVSLGAGATHYFALLVHMDELAGNEYKNGKVEFDLTVLAAQDTVESDSFGTDYDENALYPDVTVIKAEEGKTVDQVAEDKLSANEEVINVALSEDTTFDVKPYAQKPMGGDKTKVITIDGQGHKLIFNNTNSDWNNVTWGDAKLIIKNAVIDNSGHNADGGTWNGHDITFKGNVELENVTFTNAVAIEGTAVLKNVSISDKNATQQAYMLWIRAGSTVTLDNCTIDGTSNVEGIKNCAIAIKDQYVTDPGMTTLTINGATISSDEKAAVLVTSAGGADITMTNVDISGTQDKDNAVWYDGDGTNISVSGCQMKER